MIAPNKNWKDSESKGGVYLILISSKRFTNILWDNNVYNSDHRLKLRGGNLAIISELTSYKNVNWNGCIGKKFPSL